MSAPVHAGSGCCFLCPLILGAFWCCFCLYCIICSVQQKLEPQKQESKHFYCQNGQSCSNPAQKSHMLSEWKPSGTCTIQVSPRFLQLSTIVGWCLSESKLNAIIHCIHKRHDFSIYKYTVQMSRHRGPSTDPLVPKHPPRCAEIGRRPQFCMAAGAWFLFLR